MYDDSVVSRFWAKVNIGKPDECWEWQAYRIPKKYGMFGVDGQSTQAHRVAYTITNGEIPPGMLVCHTCDNRYCVNPAHLFLGTHADNSHDMIKKGRGHYRNLMPDEVVAIRAAFDSGASKYSLAKKYGVTWRAIAKIVNYVSWRDVERAL